jgi:hypothetical protein
LVRPPATRKTTVKLELKELKKEYKNIRFKGKVEYRGMLLLLTSGLAQRRREARMKGSAKLKSCAPQQR